MRKRCFGPWSAALPTLLTLTCLGCSADPGSDSTRRGTSPITVAVDGNGKCTEPGPQACYCGDGTARGTQTCNPDGSLSPCSCPTVSAQGGSGGAGGGSGAPAMLCAELAGKSGCMAQSYESQELPASILFVIDRSKSMDCNPPPLQDTASCEAMATPKDPGQPTRWDITIDALKDAFAELHASNATAAGRRPGSRRVDVNDQVRALTLTWT